jgi:hypothetical protein
MPLFQDQITARNRYKDAVDPLKVDASKGLCYWNCGNLYFEKMLKDARSIYALPFDSKGSKDEEEIAHKFAVELSTFSYNGLMNDFGARFLRPFVKKQVNISDRNLNKFGLEQVFIPSWQNNPLGAITEAINMDTRYGFALNYRDRPIAVMGVCPEWHRMPTIAIKQLQGVNSFRGCSEVRGKIKWAHALVTFALDWASELGIKKVVLQSVKNNHWVVSHFSQLVGLGFPIKDFDEAMIMDPKALRKMANETLEANRDKLTKYPTLFLPSDGFMVYDLTARRLRWRGKRFEQMTDGDYSIGLN